MIAQYKRWLHLLAGTVMFLFLGLIYAWSTFAAPLEKEFGWNRGQTSFTFTLSITFFVLGLIVSGALAAKMKKQAIILIAAGFMFAGFALCSRTTTLLELYLFYGVLVSFGVGIANSAVVSTIVRWFPDKTGLASGILMMGFGLGGLALGQAAVNMFDSYGWRSTFMVFGVSFFIIMALGSIWIVPPPSASSPDKSTSPAGESADIGGLDVLKRSSFWTYILWFALVMAGGLIVIGHASTFAQDLGMTQRAAAVAAGIFSISNGFGRVLTGIVFDRFGLRISMRLTTGYIVLAAALLVGACVSGNVPFMIAGFILTGLGYGGCPTTSSTFANTYYGPKYFSINYGMVSSGMIPGAILGPWIAGMLRTSSGGYLSSFAIMIGFGAAAMLALRFIKRPSGNQ